jgi:hypothetical protein
LRGAEEAVALHHVDEAAAREKPIRMRRWRKLAEAWRSATIRRAASS